LIGAERAVSAALALLLSRERTGVGSMRTVALFDGAQALAAPLRHGTTAPGGLLGGQLPEYDIYPTRRGAVAVGCLEPHFSARLAQELGLERLDHGTLQQALQERDAADWERWAAARDLPIVALRDLHG
jgi:crotonobetainyl-CoA:carnitine CoA-transferase CaiB-like acyl-CoA transferase